MALFNDNKHGFRVSGSMVDMSLVRGSYSPDAFPDLGSVFGKYAVRPYYGLVAKSAFQKDAMAFNSPLVGIAGSIDSDSENSSNIMIDCDSVTVLSVKPSFDGRNIVLTTVEADGRDTQTSIYLPAGYKYVYEVDLKQDIIKSIPVDGSVINVCYGKNEIKSFMFVLEESFR